MRKIIQNVESLSTHIRTEQEGLSLRHYANLFEVAQGETLS